MSYEHGWYGVWKLLTPPFRKYIHYRGYFLLIFIKIGKTKFFEKLKTWTFGENLTPKLTSKKTFLKPLRGHFLASLIKSITSRHVLWQWKLLLMTKAFHRCKLESRTSSQKFFKATNLNFLGFLKMAYGALQNPANLTLTVPTWSWKF